MNPFAEPARQIAYQRKLAAQLGWRGALLFRAAMLGARLGLHPGITIKLKPRSLAHPVHVRLSSSDPDVYAQVLLAEEYAPAAQGNPRTIVDLGANAGYTSAWFLSRFPDARVIAVEPLAANAALCKRNLAPYGDRATVVHAAIWSAPTRLVIEHHQGNEWGAHVRPARTGEQGDIDAIDIPSLGLPQIDILKIDIEGSEERLFREGAERWLPTVRAIAVELHGTACEAAFRSALAPYIFEERRAGELTICVGIHKA